MTALGSISTRRRRLLALGLLGAVVLVMGMTLLFATDGTRAGTPEDGYRPAIPGTGAVLQQDIAGAADPVPKWGNINPYKPSQVQKLTSGGDGHPLVDGSSNGNFRRINILDGDRGANDPLTRERLHVGARDDNGFYPFGKAGTESSVILYMSFRLQPQSPSFPSQTGAGSKTQIWQLLHDESCGEPPRIEMDERVGDRVALVLNAGGGGGETVLWSGQVERDIWHRIAVRMHLSDNPSQGSIQLFGDVGPGGRMFPLMENPVTTNTLRGGTCGSRANLFIGRYQNTDVGPSRIDLANIQLTRWNR